MSLTLPRASSTIVHETPDAVSEETAKGIVPFDQFWDDVSKDKLPTFSFVDYDSVDSMEYPKNVSSLTIGLLYGVLTSTRL